MRQRTLLRMARLSGKWPIPNRRLSAQEWMENVSGVLASPGTCRAPGRPKQRFGMNC